GDFGVMVISNGGTLADNIGVIGLLPGSRGNLAVITGPGSSWSNTVDLYIGYEGTGNALIVSNGGMVINNVNAQITSADSLGNNNVVVTDPGSTWTCGGRLTLGNSGFALSPSSLLIRNGGTVIAGGVSISWASAGQNQLLVDNGNLIVTNGTGTAILD